MERMTIGLGKVRGSSQHQKAGKAINEIKREVSRHTDVADVRITNNLNEQVWQRGASKPPRRVEVELLDMEEFILVDTAEGEAQETAVTEEQLEAVDEEETEDTSGEEDADQENDQYDIPEDVKETLREGTIDDGKEAVKGLNKTDMDSLLAFEEKHKNRKGMKQFLESNKR